jgi:hypothetical protein
MSRILKRTSFGLLRTNPKLTTNIKIIADSKNKVYLESFDADPLLSKSIYKGFEVTGGSYSRDLRRFYTQGSTLPKSIAYTLFEEDDSTDVKNRYNNQYDFTYGMGMQPKNSRLYTEEFSILSPLWIEKDNIPDYFLVFKLDGPVTVNTNDPNIAPIGTNLDLDPGLNSLVVDPSQFFENYLKGSKIIKTFDLTYKTEIGSYIRRHAEDPLFPESSIYISFDKNNLSYWQGISYDEGGFCKKAKEIYKDYVLIDKTITENDDFITLGFQENSVVHPNILNLEFLFDDVEQENFKFSRYFGLYVSEAELGKFIIDGNRLFNDKDNENTQIPRPIKNEIGFPTTQISQIQNNEKGIKIYPKIGPTGASSTILPYSGRLINFEETQNPRIPYIKDTKGNFYSINSTNSWTSTFFLPGTAPNYNPIPYEDSNYLRIKDTKVDWKNFSGLDVPFSYIDCKITNNKGKASFSFQITGSINSGDEIRIKNVDWNDPIQFTKIDNYTLRGDSAISAGNNNGLSFSTNGTGSDIAKAIVKSIKYISVISGDYQVFYPISKNNEVIVFIPNEAENWNKIKYTVYSTSSIFPFTFPEGYSQVELINYLPSPVSLSSTIPNSKVYSYHFVGANTNPKSRIIIERNKVFEFRSLIEPIYVKTLTGFSEATQFSLYLDEPIKDSSGNVIDFKDYEKYFVLELSDINQSFDINSSKKVGLYKTIKNRNGYLSIYPIRDFDFDFYDTSYSKDADSKFESLYNWYNGTTGPNGEIPLFSWSSIGSTGQNFINSILGPTSSFAIGGGFQKLNGLINDYEDTNESVTNEYDRLKENVLPELALSSRVVPFINKWVYDNESVDVRENGYRLNTDQSFGYSNFSPSFDEFSKNSKFFTHEWYYLQKYPPYMDFTEKLNSFSYFEDNLNFPIIPFPGSQGSTSIYNALVSATGPSANLLSINEDYFLSYFTKETVDGLPVPREFKYSLFSYGDSMRFSETLFRGAKVIIKDRSEYSSINYNIESLRFLSNPIYNGYRYSAILTYGNAGTQITCIKNDKWKTLTTIIQSNVSDLALSKYNKALGNPIYGWGTTSIVTSGKIYTDTTDVGPLTTKIYVNRFDGNSVDQTLILDQTIVGSIIDLYPTLPALTRKYEVLSVNIIGDIYEFDVQYISGPSNTPYNPPLFSFLRFKPYSKSESFIDRSLLYTLQNSLEVGPTGQLEISDTTLSGSIVDFTWTTPNDFFDVIGAADQNGNLPNFINELVFNENGGYNDISVGSLSTYYFKFREIFDVTPTTFKCKFIDTNLPTGGPSITTLLPSGGGWTFLKFVIWNNPVQQALWPVWDSILSSTPTYSKGGFNAYQAILDGISFAKISDSINTGDPEIRYISVSETGQVEFNKFCIEIVKPDTPIKSSYIKSIPLRNKPVDLQTAVRTLGYEMVNEERMSINQITRYRGGYNPRWKDVFKFVDTEDIKLESLDYKNVQILTQLSHIQDDNLGLLKNVYFNKVNVENPNVILRSASSTKEQNIFPLIGEIAIDYSDFFTFRSNWDPFYFRKYIKSNVFESVIGTREPKEEKSFFGSKTIAIPNTVTLETFPEGILNSSNLITLNQISKVPQNIVKTEEVNKNGTILILDVFTDLALADFLISQGFSSDFIKYMNPEYSFGDPILEDDIRAYILENIKQRYVVKNIIFWEKFWNMGDPYPEIQTNFTDSQKISNGYVTSRSFNTKFLSPDDLNFQLIYNIPQDKNFSIAFTVILEKK